MNKTKVLTYKVTLDIACKGKGEDIANMKKRLKAIRQDHSILESQDKLKVLFGDQLNEIQADHEQIFNFFTCAMADNLVEPPELKLSDINEENKEKDCTFTFGGLLYNWDKADIDNMQFSNYIEYDPWTEDESKALEDGSVFCGKEIYLFTSSLECAFPRVKFNFISYSECKDKFYAAYENSDSYRDYYYFGKHKDQLDMYINWKKEYRNTWLAGHRPSIRSFDLKKALFDVYIDPNYEDSEDYYSIEYTWGNHYG